MSASEVRVELQSVLHVPQSDVRRACCKNEETSRRVVGSHGNAKLSFVGELVMLHAMACNDVSHGLLYTANNRGPRRTDP